MAWGVTCSWKKSKVFNQVKLTLFKYSLFIFKVQRVWVFFYNWTNITIKVSDS